MWVLVETEPTTFAYYLYLIDSKTAEIERETLVRSKRTKWKQLKLLSMTPSL